MSDQSNYLTTGQMIDSLKYGEIAEAVTGFYEGSKLMRTVHDEIVFVDYIGGGESRFIITAFALYPKWKIYKNPLMTDRICENCEFIEMYSETCPVGDDDTEHLDDGLMISCKCFKGIEATEQLRERSER